MPLVVTITIPDAAVVDAQAALSAKAGLPSTGPNAKLGLIEMIKRETKHYRIKAAADTAAVAAGTQADTDLSGIT